VDDADRVDPQAAGIREVHRRSLRPGQRPIDPVVMVKAMFLQKLYGLSNPQIEEQLLDRISFRRFVGWRRRTRHRTRRRS